MADETLGTAQVEITASLAPLAAELAQAEVDVGASVATMSAELTKVAAAAQFGAQGVITASYQMAQGASAAAASVGAAMAQIGASMEAVPTASAKLEAGLGSIKETLIAIGAIELGRKFEEIVTSSAEAAEAIKNSAAAVGLEADEFQIFAYAAREAGVEQGKFTQGIDFLARNVGKIAQGETSQATAAFAALGISIKNADGTTRSFGDILPETLTKLGQVKDPMLAAAYATELFQRGGVALIPVAKELANEGFDQISAKAREMGLVVDKEVIGKAAELSEEFKTLSTVLQADAIQAIVAMGPALIQLTNLITAEATAWGDFAQRFAQANDATVSEIGRREAVMGNLINSLKDEKAAIESGDGNFVERWFPAIAQQRIHAITSEIQTLTPQYNALLDLLDKKTSIGITKPVGAPVTEDDGSAAAQEKAQEQFEKTNDAIQRQAADYARLDDAVGQNSDVMRQAQLVNEIQAEIAKLGTDATADMVRQIVNSTIELNANKNAFQDDTKYMQEWDAEMKKEGDATNAFLASLEKAHTPLEKLQDDMDHLNSLFATGDISLDEYNQGLAGAWDQYTKLDAQAQKTANTMADEVSSAISRGASSFLDLASGAQKSTSFMQQLGQAGLSLAQDLLKVVEQLFVLNPLINALKSALGSNGAPLPVGDLGGIEAGVKKLFGFGSASPEQVNTAVQGGDDALTQAGGYNFPSSAAGNAASAAVPSTETMLGNLFSSVGKDIEGGGGEVLKGAESLFGSIFDGLGSLVAGAGGELSGLFTGIGQLFGFANGGAFDVGGAGGVDSQLVQFKATPGEHVSVGQDRGPTSGAPNVIINNNHSKVGDSDISAERHPNGRDVMVTIAEAMAHDTRIGGPLGRAQKETWGLNRVPIQR